MTRVSVIIVIVIIFSGCKSKKFISGSNDFERLRRTEVLERIADEEKRIDNVFFRRSTVKMRSEKGVQSFRSNIFIHPDSFIRVSVLAPMGIELARISFEENQVLILDRMNRVIIYTNYDEVYQKFGAHLNYDILQNVLLDKAFSYHSDKGLSLEDYHFDLDKNQYLFSSMKEKQYQRLVSRNQIDGLVFQNIWVDPSLFLMRRTQLSLKEKNVELDIQYDEFVRQEIGWFFPEFIKVIGKGESQNDVQVTISHSSIRFNDDNGISFKIPDKYEKIYR